MNQPHRTPSLPRGQSIELKSQRLVPFKVLTFRAVVGPARRAGPGGRSGYGYLLEQDSVCTERNVSLENRSLAVDAHAAVTRVPPGELADNLRQLAARIDAGFLALSHDVPNRGFVYFADPATGQPRPDQSRWVLVDLGQGHGVDMTSTFGVMGFKRTSQLPEGPTKNAYRDLTLCAADVCLATNPDLRTAEIWAGEYGAAVFLQMMAYR